MPVSGKTLLNIFLFFIVLLLAAIIFYSEDISTDLETLTRINSSTIQSIGIQHNKNKTTLTKDADQHWHITSPIDIAANDFRINTILKLLNAPVHKRYRSSEIDMQKIGLLDPATSITFNNIKISFGITNPATSLRFIRIGETISTIQDVYSPLLSSHFSTLVSLNLLPADKSTFPGLKKLVLINQTLNKDDKGFWHSSLNISADRINKILEHWQHDQAFGVHQYLERKNLGDVFIYRQQPVQKIHYQITDTDPWLILARPEIGLEYHLDIDAYDHLIAPQ